jgi:hypothetical protein
MIYPWRLPKIVGWPAAALLLCMSIAVHYLEGSLVLPGGAAGVRLRLTLALVAVPLFLVSAVSLVVSWSSPSWLSVGGLWLGMLLGNVAYAYNDAGQVKDVARLPIIMICIILFMSVISLVCAASPGFARIISVLANSPGLILLIFVILPNGVWMFMCVAFRLGRAVMAQSVLSSAALRGEVEKILHDAVFAIPAYTTAAELRSLVDPDRVYEVRTGAAATWMALTGLLVNPNQYYEHKLFIPRYLLLNGMNSKDVVNALLATAALPLGIVRHVVFQGKKLVDGGVVDNRPILPLLDESCDEIIVVSLSPVSAEAAEAERLRCQEVQRRIVLDRLDLLVRRFFPRSGATNDPPMNLPLPAIPSWPKITFLGPSVSLGGFLNGTLNFDADYCRRLIDLGRGDALRFLAGNPRFGQGPVIPERAPGELSPETGGAETALGDYLPSDQDVLVKARAMFSNLGFSTEDEWLFCLDEARRMLVQEYKASTPTEEAINKRIEKLISEAGLETFDLTSAARRKFLDKAETQLREELALIYRCSFGRIPDAE